MEERFLNIIIFAMAFSEACQQLQPNLSIGRTEVGQLALYTWFYFRWKAEHNGLTSFFQDEKGKILPFSMTMGEDSFVFKRLASTTYDFYQRFKAIFFLTIFQLLVSVHSIRDHTNVSRGLT